MFGCGVKEASEAEIGDRALRILKTMAGLSRAVGGRRRPTTSSWARATVSLIADALKVRSTSQFAIGAPRGLAPVVVGFAKSPPAEAIQSGLTALAAPRK